ncbi:MAG: molybdopterin-synthase adenylyltransferase MoeB [Lautropia sp.]|nr:molybdopterin-synthase adenylyltransferase MoeB [Lautropia sp.]
MNDEQLLRYSRHILLDEVGIDAQQRLIDATALIIGAGGLGSPAALYLASAGVGRLLLADGDEVDLTNLQRQILHRNDRIGMPKVASARLTLGALNPDVEVIPLPRLADAAAGEASVGEAVRGADVVLDCSDNFATRHALNRWCVRHRVPLVSGAAIRFDGQLAVFDSRNAASPCYNCLFPEADDVEEVLCSQMGVFAPLTGIIGTMQAGQALQLLGGFGKPLVGELLLIDALTLGVSRVRVPRDPACTVCGPVEQ